MSRRDNAHADSTNGTFEVYEQALRRILWTLRAYLPDIIIVGGWVPHLYRRHGGFATWHGRLSLTAEVDVMVSPSIGTESRPPIAELLTAEGFTWGGGSVPAAVWTNAPERGERVEFLVPHNGTRQDVGHARALPQQPALSAIALPELAIMERFTRELYVPITTDQGGTRLRIRVPLLAAYVANKAITFPKRQRLTGDLSNPKRAKDVLYLRDLMAAGREVQDDIRAGLQTIAATGRGACLSLSTARNNLDGLLRGALRPVIAEVADALLQRDDMQSVEAARADVEGHLTDLSEDIADVLT